MQTATEDTHIYSKVDGAERNKQGACGATDSANGFYPLGWGFESLQARMTKKCLKCGITKDLNEFLVKPGQRVGARGICKECFEEK